MRNIMMRLLSSAFLFLFIGTAWADESLTLCERGFDEALTELNAQRSAIGDAEYAKRLKRLQDERTQCLGYCAQPPPLPKLPVPQASGSGCTDKCSQSFGQLVKQLRTLEKAYKDLQLPELQVLADLRRDVDELHKRVGPKGADTINVEGLTEADKALIGKLNERLRRVKEDHDVILKRLEELDGIKDRLTNLERAATNPDVPPAPGTSVAEDLTRLQGELKALAENSGAQSGVLAGEIQTLRERISNLNVSDSGGARNVILGFGLGANADLREQRFDSTFYTASFVVGGKVWDGRVPLRLFGRVGFGGSTNGLLKFELGPEFLASFEGLSPKMAWLEVGVQGKLVLDVRPDFKADRCPTATAWAIGGGPLLKFKLGKGFSIQASVDFLYLSWARCGETQGQIPSKDGMAETVVTLRPLNFEW